MKLLKLMPWVFILCGLFILVIADGHDYLLVESSGIILIISGGIQLKLLERIRRTHWAAILFSILIILLLIVGSVCLAIEYYGPKN